MIQKLIISIIFAINTINAVDVPVLKLNNGLGMPIVGYGTMRSTEDAIRLAINAGYRHFDTSYNYNESEVYLGNVLKAVLAEGKIKRSDLFIVSKLESDSHARSKVPEAIKKSLARIQLDYLDLYLIHSPSPATPDVLETWLGMMDVLKANLTKSIGVSNFSPAQIDHIVANGTNAIPVTNQVQSNPYHTQKTLLDYSNKHNITVTAWSPIGGSRDLAAILVEPKLVDIAKKHNVTVAQVALRYQVQRGVIVIPKASSEAHILENINLFDFTLTDDDIKVVESLNKS